MKLKIKSICTASLALIVIYAFLSVPARCEEPYIENRTDSAVLEPIQYDENTPDYIRDMNPETVLLYQNHPAIREFPDTYLENNEKSFWKRKFLTGDWNGLRTKLSNKGVLPTLTYVADIQGNPVGGARQGFKYFHNIGLDLIIHTEKLFGLKGGRFHVSVSQRSGESLTKRDIMNTFNVAQVCCGDTYKLVNLSYEQALYDELLNIRLGRISGGDEFLSSPLYWLFVQNGIDGNPVGIFFNAGFSAYPNAAWGVRVKSHPSKNFYIMAGAYNANQERVQDKNHGADFTFDGPYFFIAETGYHLNGLMSQRGLAGNYKLGGYHQTGDYPFFSDPERTKNGKWGFYVLIDQMIYREKGGYGKSGEQGLTPFGAFLFAPDDEINTLPFFMNLGLVYKGLIPTRNQDYAGFALVYGKFSDKLEQGISGSQVPGTMNNPMRPQEYEAVLEWMYKIQITPFLNIQPDIQYVINPGGRGDIKDALVLGFQLGLSM